METYHVWVLIGRKCAGWCCEAWFQSFVDPDPSLVPRTGRSFGLVKYVVANLENTLALPSLNMDESRYRWSKAVLVAEAAILLRKRWPESEIPTSSGQRLGCSGMPRDAQGKRVHNLCRTF